VTIVAIGYSARCTEGGWCENLASMGLCYADVGGRPMSNSELFQPQARAERFAASESGGSGSTSWRPRIAASERNLHNFSETMVWITFLWMFPFAIRGRDRPPVQAGLATFNGHAVAA
jgi:hypothetical protein